MYIIWVLFLRTLYAPSGFRLQIMCYPTLSKIDLFITEPSPHHFLSLTSTIRRERNNTIKINGTARTCPEYQLYLLTCDNLFIIKLRCQNPQPQTQPPFIKPPHRNNVILPVSPTIRKQSSLVEFRYYYTKLSWKKPH